MAHGGFLGQITSPIGQLGGAIIKGGRPVSQAWKSINPDTMGAIGAGVGAYFGGPVGGAIGGAAGSYLRGGSDRQSLEWGAAGSGMGYGMESMGAGNANGMFWSSAPSAAADYTVPVGGPMTAQGASDAALLGEGVPSSSAGLGTSGAATGGGAASPTLMQQLGQVANLVTTGYGLYAGSQMVQAQKRAQEQRDAQAAQQAKYRAMMEDLQRNPSSIVNLPGYQSGLDAVQRRMAAQGYQGSGNMMAELANYGQNVYNQQYTNLANLSGAQYSPANYAPDFNPAGYQLIGQSLNRLGTTASAAGF